jgi:hypothetical protein
LITNASFTETGILTPDATGAVPNVFIGTVVAEV